MIYLKIQIGRFRLCDLEWLRWLDRPQDEIPPQLNGGTGTVLYPDPTEDCFGFTRRTP